MSERLSPEELILRPERKRLVPLSDTTVWRMERRGKFPRRIAISDKRVAWRRSEIEAWLEERTAVDTGRADQFKRLAQEIAAAATVEDANRILITVDLLDLTEDEIAKLTDIAHDK